MESSLRMILILIIFEGSPRSVTLHLKANSFMCSIPLFVVANNNGSLSCLLMYYAQGSESRYVNPNL